MPKHVTFYEFIKNAPDWQIRKMYQKGNVIRKALLIKLRPQVIKKWKGISYG